MIIFNSSNEKFSIETQFLKNTAIKSHDTWENFTKSINYYVEYFEVNIYINMCLIICCFFEFFDFN